MSFISTIAEDQAPDDVKRMYDQNLEKLGFIPNFWNWTMSCAKP
jgi:hypothetical protein